MAVFAVVASVGADKLGAAVVAQYGANHFQFSPTVWLVPDIGTSKDVSDKLGLSNGAVGAQGLVLSFSGYSGYAGTGTWTWLQKQPGLLPNG